MTPADPDLLAMPDPDSLIQLPWKPEVAWVAADPSWTASSVEQAPRNVLKRVIAEAAEQGLHVKTGVECEFFLISARRLAISDAADHAGEALLRPAGADAPLRRDHRDLRLACSRSAGARTRTTTRTRTASSR